MEENKKMNNDIPLMAKISLSSRLFHKKMKVLCEKKGINSTYFKIIMAISRNTNANQLDIVNDTRLSAPTVSLTLRHMEEEGIIKREVDKVDQRNVIVSLTELGIKMDNDIKLLFDELEKEIKDIFSDNELNIINNGLDKIDEYLERK